MTTKHIGVFAPASALNKNTEDKEALTAEQTVHIGVEYLESLGYKVSLAKNLYSVFDQEGINTAGNVQERREAFHELYPQVDIMLALRGGYGCLQLLDTIDYSMIISEPKPILGYSDLTALLLAVQRKSLAQCYHTPMLAEFHKWTEPTRLAFEELLSKLPSAEEMKFGAKLNVSQLEILKESLLVGDESTQIAIENLLEETDIKVFGGNLSIICSLLGTPYLPDFENSILFLEEVNEPKYKIDRMLNQLFLAGKLKKLKAIWVGNSLDAEGNDSFAYELLEELCYENNIPLLRNLEIGHGPINLSLPLG